MAAYVGATVVHRVRVNERKGVGLTACGIRFSLADRGYDPNGAHTEAYVDWLNNRLPVGRLGYVAGRFLKCRCSHCDQREPAWDRLRRERARKQRRLARQAYYGRTGP
jgi:hypothetical protein